MGEFKVVNDCGNMVFNFLGSLSVRKVYLCRVYNVFLYC